MKKILAVTAALFVLVTPAWAAPKTVTFDDTRTTVDALTKATADAGYPSTVKEGSAK